MDSTMNIVGRMTMPNSPGGSTTPLLIGTPTVLLADAATGAEVDYTEKAEFWATILAGATQIINFGTVSAASFLYIGADKAVQYTIDGGSAVDLAAGGFVMIKGSDIAALTVKAGILDANVYVLILGD